MKWQLESFYAYIMYEIFLQMKWLRDVCFPMKANIFCESNTPNVTYVPTNTLVTHYYSLV